MVLSKDEFLYLIFIVAIAFMLLLLFFIIMVILNVKIRKQKEIEKLNAVITTQENERKRIAEDMHDEIGPMLSAIKLQINTFGSHAIKEELEESIKETSNHLDTVIQNIRGIVKNLSPAQLHKQGLIQSIEDFRMIIKKDIRVQFNFQYDSIDEKWNEQAEANIYRIVHELINNSLKHSNCNEINLSLRRYEKTFLIQYTDNGTMKMVTKNDSVGMGMQNIKSRVAMLGGKLINHNDFSHGAFYQITIESKNLFENIK